MESVKVVISNDQKAVKVPTGIRLLIRRCCHAVLELEHFEGSAEVSVRFVDNEQIRELNKAYRNIDLANGKYVFCWWIMSWGRTVCTTLTTTPAPSCWGIL